MTAIEDVTTRDDEPYDRQREKHARDLLRSWADAASNAGCPPAFVARMRTFADMHDRHAAEAAESGTDQQLAAAAGALVAIGKACIVVAPTLRKPYADDPTQNPWDKFVHEPASRAYNLGHELRRELRARGVEVPR